MRLNPSSVARMLGRARIAPEAASARLSRLLEHAFERVPFYRKHFLTAGVRPGDIHSPRDLTRIPLTSKADFQAVPLAERIPDNMDLRQLAGFTTSGTTGRPLEVKVSPDDAAVNHALSLRILRHHGWMPWHRRVNVTGEACQPTSRSRFSRLGLLRCDTVSSRWPTSQWASQLQRLRPHYLFGYCLTLRLMARAIKRERLQGIHPRCVLATAGVLDRATREEIADGFGCEVYDVYASWEGGMMAWECRQCGGYHVNDDWVIVEILRDGRPVEPGEQGEVVITNLHSFGMPFIRYRLGDMATRPENSSSCGCPLSTLTSILGRTADMIVSPSGALLSPHAFFHLMDTTPGIVQWRLTQTEIGCFSAEIVPGQAFGVETEQAIRRGLSGLMGDNVRLEVSTCDHLMSAPGAKFRPVRSDVAPLRRP